MPGGRFFCAAGTAVAIGATSARAELNRDSGSGKALHRATRNHRTSRDGHDSKRTDRQQQSVTGQAGVLVFAAVRHQSQSSRSDPRFGAQNFEVTDVVIGEPDAKLFAVPSGSKMINLKSTVGPGRAVTSSAVKLVFTNFQLFAEQSTTPVSAFGLVPRNKKVQGCATSRNCQRRNS